MMMILTRLSQALPRMKISYAKRAYSDLEQIRRKIAAGDRRPTGRGDAMTDADIVEAMRDDPDWPT